MEGRNGGKPKGAPKTGGRKKGTPNKHPVELKQAIFGALHSGDGAEAYMVQLKKQRPELFSSLLKAFIPKDVNVTADVAAVVTVVRSFVEKPQEE